MAYRWQPEEYRQPHNGQSVFGGGMIPNLRHPDTTPQYSSSWTDNVTQQPFAGSSNNRRIPPYMQVQPWSAEDEMGNYTQTGANKMYTFTKSTPKNSYLGTDDDGPDADFKPLGGSTVPRKPKPNPKSPSGGMALPLPQKVK